MNPIKILVNNPQGDQEILSLEPSGSYFDSASVLWDERKDGPLPANVASNLGGLVRQGNTLGVDAAALAAAQAKRAQAQSDAQAVFQARQDRWARIKSADLSAVPPAFRAILKDIVDELKDRIN